MHEPFLLFAFTNFLPFQKRYDGILQSQLEISATSTSQYTEILIKNVHF